jgi:hypothetical protein
MRHMFPCQGLGATTIEVSCVFAIDIVGLVAHFEIDDGRIPSFSYYLNVSRSFLNILVAINIWNIK